MTDTQFTALIEALPAIITALGTLIIGVLIALSRKRDEKADKKTDKLVQVTDQIHQVTNSNFTAITAELKTANAKYDQLQKVIVNLNKDKVVADEVAKKLAEKVPSQPSTVTELATIVLPEQKEKSK